LAIGPCRKVMLAAPLLILRISPSAIAEGFEAEAPAGAAGLVWAHTPAEHTNRAATNQLTAFMDSP
jgi:hypothetical protein